MYKYILDIDGMKCNMCEARVNNIIRKNYNVKKLKSDHKTGKTEFIIEEELHIQDLLMDLANEGYFVMGFHVDKFIKK